LIGVGEMNEDDRVLVIGAGAAGLSVAAMLKRRRVPARVLERSDQVAASWRSRYESLRLNTPRLTSTLAGYRIPRRYGRWPTRDAIVEYLEEYARRQQLEVRFGVEARRLERANGAWSLDTSDGRFDARYVVIATGHDIEPKVPDWPGRERFSRELIHSAEYRNPRRFLNQDVLVVAASNSGSEIAYELACSGAGRVWTSMRTPPPVFPREWPAGIPLGYPSVLLDLAPDRIADWISQTTQWLIYRNLSPHGIPRSPVGPQTRTKKLHQGILIDAGFVDALKERRIEIVSAVRGFDGDEVVLVDGTRLRPDAVIAATGFRRGLEPLVGHLGVLDAGGAPVPVAGRAHASAPGLYFNGFVGTLSGQLRHMRRHGRAIARAIERDRCVKARGAAV
jgi:putative flavoprotein involved in K+ transport